MTEAEWFEATDVSPMLIFLRGDVELADQDPDPRPRRIGGSGELVAGPARRTTPGRLARFARECCRRWWDLPLDRHSRELITGFEQFLDGVVSEGAFRALCTGAWNGAADPERMVSVFRALDWSPTPYGVSGLTQHLAWVTATHIHRDRIADLERTATEDERFAWGFFGYDFPGFYATADTIFRPLPGLLREIVGNPFRPVTADPTWLTSSVITLALQMDDCRDFSPMAVLADALQDAGCDNVDVLNHCRGVGVHTRGCWVVDLLLGKG
jgi:hypothetical protein